MGSSRIKILRQALLTSLLMLIMVLLMTQGLIAHSQNSNELLNDFGEPLVLPLNITLRSVGIAYLDVSNGLIYVTGESSKGPIIGVINSVSLKPSPHKYPLLGSPVTFDIDSVKKPRYYVIGTNEGELLVFPAGSLKPTLKYIQGDEARIINVFVNNEGTVIATYDVNGRLFVKVFKVGVSGWTEIGDFIGNAPLKSIEGRRLVDSSLVKVLSGDDALSGNILLNAYYTIPSYLLKVKVVSSVNNTPISNAKVYVLNKETKEIFSGVTDAEGYALIPISLPIKDIVIFVKVKGTCYEYEFENVKLESIGDKVFLLSKVLVVPSGTVSLCPIETRNLILEFDKVLGNTLERVGVLNLSDVEYMKIHSFLDVSKHMRKFKYLVITSGRFTTYPSYEVLRILYLDKNFNLTHETIYRLFSSVTKVTYSLSGDVLVVGTSGGTIYVFKLADNEYKVMDSYRLPSSITSLSIADSVGGSKAIIAGDALGNVQVLYITPEFTLMPISRANTSLTLRLESSVRSITTSRDLNQVVIATVSKLYLILGLGDTLSKGILEIDLNERITQPLTISLVDPKGMYVSNATIIVKSIDGRELFNVTTNSLGFVRLNHILPGTYYIEVYPRQDYLNKSITKAEILPSTFNLTLKCTYKPVDISFTIIDGEYGSIPKEELRFIIEGLNGSKYYYVLPHNSTFTLKLLPGHYKVYVEPSDRVEGKPLYESVTESIDVPKDRDIRIVLRRNTFTLTLIFIDTEVKGPPREGFNIVLRDTEGNVLSNLSITKPSVTLKLRYKGLLFLEIIPKSIPGEEPLYFRKSYKLYLTNDMKEVIPLEVNKIDIALVLKDADTGGPPESPINVIADGKYLITIPKGTIVQHINLSKGTHELILKPKPYIKKLNISLYNMTLIKVKVVRPTIINVTLKRLYVNSTLIIKDYYSGGGPIEKLTLYINNLRVGDVPPNASKPVTLVVPLRKGLNTITLRGKNVYAEFIKKITVKEPTNITIEIPRKTFLVKLTLVNDLAQPVHGGVVKAIGIGMKFEGMSSIVNGEADLKLPYGVYTIIVDQPGYERLTIERVVTSDEEISLILKPTLITIINRYMTIFIGVAIIALILVLIYRYRAKIKSLIAPEEEIF